MMPCVAKDNSDLNSPVPAIERPKSIYKPKYHAFSIDSLVGNHHILKSHRNEDISDNNGEDEQTIRSCHKKRRTPTPNGHIEPLPPTPPSSESPTNGHKILNDNNRDQNNDDYRDYSIETTNRLLSKNGILRSYMTTNQQNISAHMASHISRGHSPGHGFDGSHTVDSNRNVICHTNRFSDSINATKYEHILNMRSNNSNHSQRNSSAVVRNSSPDMNSLSSGSTIQSSLQSSHFNTSQYYCSPMYCRPFEDRLIPGNPFLPQVCDYKMLSTKSPDICCNTTFNAYRKPKRIRTAFSPGQLLRLEEIFERNRYVVGCERKQLARDLNLSETQIKVWFQNRRTKHKRERHQQSNGKRGTTLSMMMNKYTPGLAIGVGNTSDGNDGDDIDHKY